MAKKRDIETARRPGPASRVKDSAVPDLPRSPDGQHAPDGPASPGTTKPPRVTISSIEDVLSVASRSVARGTPTLDALTDAAGLSPQLRRRLDEQRPHVTLTPQQRARLGKLAREAGPVDFRTRPVQALRRISLPPGGYDATAAFRLRALSEVLAALQAAGALSQAVDLDQDDRRNKLLFGLRLLFNGVPDGDDVVVNAWRLGSPRLVAPSGADVALLQIPFSIEVGRIGGDGVVLASLEGTLQHGVAVLAAVVDDRVTARLESGELPDGASFLEISASSQIQPKSVDDLTTFKEAIQDDVTTTFEEQIQGADEFSICPVIAPPTGSGAQLRIQRVDAKLQHDDGDGLLVLGILIGGTVDPDDGTGDPQRLSAPSMPNAADVSLRIDEALVFKLVRQAFDTGELQEAVDDLSSDLGHDVDVRDAGVELKPGVAKLLLDVNAKDVCAGFKDVAAQIVHEIRLEVFDGRIVVEEENHVDKDNWDVAFCIISAFFELLLAAMIPPFFAHRLSYYVGLVKSSGGGPERSVVSGIIDPGIPVPGTEFLPTIEVLQARVTESAIESNGKLTLREDAFSTYIHVRVLEVPEIATPDVVPQPAEGVKVQVLDQDAPAPPGDDTPPIPEDTHVFGPKVQTSKTHELIPPRRDEMLAEGETDVDGMVRLRLSPADRSTTAGTIETTTTVTTKGNFPRSGTGGVGDGPLGSGTSDGQEKIESKETFRPLVEPRPDVYFLLTLPDGTAVDSRRMDDGFFLNLRPGRLGSPDEPLKFIVRRGRPKS